MAIPYYTHSGMAGAPQFSTAARATPDILAAVLVNGFNVQAPTSAVASGGVLTLNYGSAHGYEALCHITITGASVAAANGTWRVATVPAGNQLTCTIAGLPDGALGGTISTKVAGAGWTEPFAPDATTRVFRMPAGNQRFLRVYRAANQQVFGRGYEDMPGLDTGTEPFPTMDQTTGNGATFFQGNNPGATHLWWALASPTGFYFVNLINAGFAQGIAAFFEPTESVKPADAYNTSFFTAVTGGWQARSHTGVAGAVVSATSQITTGQTYPSPINNGQRFVYGVPVIAVSTLRGLLPNAFHMLPAPAATNAGVLYSTVENITGRVRSLHSLNAHGYTAIALDEDWPEA